MTRPVVTLTTDFGEGSPYVAAMKAVLLHECPDAALVDVTHSVPAFDVVTGAFLLWAGSRHFGPNTVHLAVVDPGVGGARKALAIRLGTSLFVGPDNGIFDEVVAEYQEANIDAVELVRPAGVSATFEGRDVFAPAAGRLAAGHDLRTVGRPLWGGIVHHPARGNRVAWVDRFGNLVLSLAGPPRPVRVGGVDVTAVARTFAEGPQGAPFCYLGSLDRLEVGVREGRADTLLGASAGTPVEELAGP